MNGKVDFYEIYEYYYLPFYKTCNFKWFIIFLIGILIAIFSYLIIKFVLKRKKDKGISASLWAIAELKKLDINKLLSKENYKKFYFDLTFIIKKYLHKRYGWFTENRTDEELIRYLKDKKFDSNLLGSLEKFISGALWIKFADQEALKIQAKKDLDLVHQIVYETKIEVEKT
ncbi:hypothetical protein KAT08_04480 [Candidatus Babeliales bacterium]|nr:hypothetical protein [Candidatus Babeliales bacterium]